MRHIHMSIRPFCCIYAVLLLLLLWDAVKAEKETKKVKKGNQGEVPVTRSASMSSK